MAKKKRPTGICPLCGELTLLADSHYLPRSCYLRMRTPGAENENPYVITTDKAAQTSRQIHEYVLCDICEAKFNDRGERETLRWACDGKGNFPLLYRMRFSMEDYSFENFALFSGLRIGVDTEYFAYYALSLVWRAAIREWHSPVAPYKTKQLSLGAIQEPIRQYLHGTAPFPKNVCVVVMACADPISQVTCFEPSRSPDGPLTCYGIWTLGLRFRVMTGPIIPKFIRDACCFTSPRHTIFLGSGQKEALHAWDRLMSLQKAAA